jgi:hypothetical protein
MFPRILSGFNWVPFKLILKRHGRIMSQNFKKKQGWKMETFNFSFEGIPLVV